MISLEDRKTIISLAGKIPTKDIAQLIRVSPATVRNFCQALDLPTYVDLDKKLSKEERRAMFAPLKKVNRPPAVYDNQRPSSYGIAYELHYSLKTA